MSTAKTITKKAGAVFAAVALAASMTPMAAFATDPSTVYDEGSNPDQQTELYLVAEDWPINTYAGDKTAQDNFQVAIPTRINYALGTVGSNANKILGPTNVHMTNYSNMPAYVSHINVRAAENVSFADSAETTDTDKIYIHMNGDSLSKFRWELGEFIEGEGYQSEYQGGTPTAGNWNLPATPGGQLDITTNGAWSKLDKINPAQDTKLGVIEFTVKPGNVYAPVNPNQEFSGDPQSVLGD